MKSPTRALLLSLLVPGLGQLYLGERAKGWTLVCMTAGVMVSLAISHTWITCLLMGGIYLGVMIPAASDAFQTAQVTMHEKKEKTWAGDTIPYVIVMLLMVGPFAIPLLWQSAKFSRTAKILWTIAVILIAFLAIAMLTFSASFLDQFLKQARAG